MAIARKEADVVFEAGQSALFTPSNRIVTRVPGDELHVRALVVSRPALCELVSNVDDVLGKQLDPHLPAMRYLERYLGIVADPGGFDTDPLVFAHVERTIVDLLALVIGAGRDATEIASMRGLRAARAQAVLAEIRAHFAVRSFSPRRVAETLGLAPRYLQDLLQETGASFSERVLELRLQKARTMLMDARYNRLRISEIAEASGFNEVPYFNRCFRRRFGASPTARCAASRIGHPPPARSDGAGRPARCSRALDGAVHQLGTDIFAPWLQIGEPAARKAHPARLRASRIRRRTNGEAA
jgi:AraC-like DNA-binding protein